MQHSDGQHRNFKFRAFIYVILAMLGKKSFYKIKMSFLKYPRLNALGTCRAVVLCNFVNWVLSCVFL